MCMCVVFCACVLKWLCVCVESVCVVYVLRVCVGCSFRVLVLWCAVLCRCVWCWCWCWRAMCGVWCLWCLCVVCCVWCVARLGEKTRHEKRKRERHEKRERERMTSLPPFPPPSLLPVCRFKTSPCVGSKRIRVYRQNASMLNTCARFAGIHACILNIHTETF